MSQVYTHAQVMLWGMRYSYPGLTLSDGYRLPPGRESYADLDSELLRLVSAKLARWNERMTSVELGVQARIEVLPDKILKFERREA